MQNALAVVAARLARFFASSAPFPAFSPVGENRGAEDRDQPCTFLSSPFGQNCDRHPTFTSFVLVVFLFCAFLSLSGCAASSKRYTPPKYEFEHLDPKAQALEAIGATPTQFVVDFPNDPDSWERAFIFFNKYTERQSISESDKPVWNSSLSNHNAPSDQFLYEVKRVLEPEGFRYTITCMPSPKRSAKGSTQQAILNAQNLARFIRDGTLEVSLLQH